MIVTSPSQLKRQHSAEPLNANSRKSPASVGTASHGATPPATELDSGAIPIPPTLSNNVFGELPDDSIIGSPLKKHRASLYDLDSEGLKGRLGTNFASSNGIDVLAAAEASQAPLPAAAPVSAPAAPSDEMEEEL